jgi:hypothetical protein
VRGTGKATDHRGVATDRGVEVPQLSIRNGLVSEYISPSFM